jgi:hypothetical protein
MVLEKEGGWIMEEDRMMGADDLENDDSGGRGQGDNDVGDRESKDDLEDEEKHENDNRRGRGDTEMIVGTGENKDDLEDEKDYSKGRGKGNNDVGARESKDVVGGAKRKRTEDGMVSEQGDYGHTDAGVRAPSLKMINGIKLKSSSRFKNTGYYNEISKSFRELIKVYEHPQEKGTSSSSSWMRELKRERLVEFTRKESDEYLSPVKRIRTTLGKGAAAGAHRRVRLPPRTTGTERAVCPPPLGWNVPRPAPPTDPSAAGAMLPSTALIAWRGMKNEVRNIEKRRRRKFTEYFKHKQERN